MSHKMEFSGPTESKKQGYEREPRDIQNGHLIDPTTASAVMWPATKSQDQRRGSRSERDVMAIDAERIRVEHTAESRMGVNRQCLMYQAAPCSTRREEANGKSRREGSSE